MSYSKFVLFIAAAVWLWGCSEADTLGDEPPREIEISGVPTWENGMSELTQLKCGYCHAVPKPEIAPDNILADLDLNQYETAVTSNGVVRGADAIGRWVAEGILDHAVESFANTSKPRQMPLDYGTPVTEREKGYFEEWSAKGSPRSVADLDVEPSGNAEAGRALYFSACSACHSLGEGVQLEAQIWLGSALRKEAVTTAKIQSMWLTKVEPNPLSHEDTANLRAFILQLLQ